MASRLFFHTADDGTIILMGRLEGDGVIGDMYAEIKPGENWLNLLSYEDLHQAGAGQIRVHRDGSLSLPG
jgi:hypothetical protein